jgi:hypothetical protein
VVTYCTFSINTDDFTRHWSKVKDCTSREIKQSQGEKNSLFRLIRREGLRREFPLIIATIKAFTEGKVAISPDKKVVDARGNHLAGYDLTTEIEKMIK